MTQRVGFLFLTRCKGTFKRVPCDKTLFISNAEQKYLSDSKGTAVFLGHQIPTIDLRPFLRRSAQIRLN